jgi:hypothetical protein
MENRNFPQFNYNHHDEIMLFTIFGIAICSLIGFMFAYYSKNPINALNFVAMMALFGTFVDKESNHIRVICFFSGMVAALVVMWRLLIL